MFKSRFILFFILFFLSTLQHECNIFNKISTVKKSRLKINSLTCLICSFIVVYQVVIIKAVTVLCTMAESSGTFMQRRVIKDAIPCMTAFIDKQASVSLKAGPVYSQSQSFKQQIAVLRSLGRLCRQLEISEATLSTVVWACAPYLSCRQPKELQQVGKMLQFLKCECVQ